MPRSTGTQTRSFTYSGSDMLTATNPENGTVTYTYETRTMSSAEPTQSDIRRSTPMIRTVERACRNFLTCITTST